MSGKNLPKLVTVVGPTASGKTEVGIHLAKKYDGEVVSADSRQVYKEFNVGTAKPEERWMQKGDRRVYMVEGVPHHLMDEVDPKEAFTLKHYQDRALKAITGILAREKLPLLVGGTGLYIKAVLENYNIPAVPPDEAFRSRLKNKSTENLFKKLKEKDHDAAEITGKNKRRIIRALEVIHHTGNKFSEERGKGPKLFNVLKIGIKHPKKELMRRVEERLGEMLNKGLVDEVKKLAQKYSWSLPPMQSIGYQEFKEYLDGKETLKEAQEKLLQNYKDFIRRQIVWFKRDKEIRWVSDVEEAKELVDVFLS